MINHEEKSRENSMQLRECTAVQFASAITSDPADNFAKTFVAKANMQKQWDFCVGAWDEDNLMGAIITTISKRSPVVANLQLLHTFNKYRGKGVAKALCEDSLDFAIRNGASYFRVSAEPDAVKFYEKIGFKMLGRQKSNCQLSMFKVESRSFHEGNYDIRDPVISKAVNKKGKGGCVEIFVQNQEVTVF